MPSDPAQVNTGCVSIKSLEILGFRTEGFAGKWTARLRRAAFYPADLRVRAACGEYGEARLAKRSVTRVGSTAWVSEGQLSFFFDRSRHNRSPSLPFRIYAVPLSKGQTK